MENLKPDTKYFITTSLGNVIIFHTKNNLIETTAAENFLDFMFPEHKLVFKKGWVKVIPKIGEFDYVPEYQLQEFYSEQIEDVPIRTFEIYDWVN